MSLPRREFLLKSFGGLAGLTLGSALSAQAAAIDSGQMQNGNVTFAKEDRPTEPPAGSPQNPLSPSDRLGFAVVALGRLSVDQILPAFGHSKNARLAGLVSGSPDKARALAAQYGVKPESVYTYETFDQINDNPDIKAIYVVLPNSMHAEYTIRGAQAGKHVLCEKPMATSSAEAQKMIDACAKANVKLMIAYRCQYEPYNRAVMALVQTQGLGAIGLITAENVQNQGDINQWRLKKAMAGGGSLPDVGLYCLNTSRAVLNEEPYEVYATIFNPPNDHRFTEVEDTISFMLKFPSGAIANCASSYSLHGARRMEVYGAKASTLMENAFAYHGQELTQTNVEGTSEAVIKPRYDAKDQFALELDHFADCVARNVTPHTPGEEGLQDHRVMEAIYESARTQRPVKVPPPAGPTRGPDPVQT